MANKELTNAARDIYESLAEHQRTEDWPFRDCLADLHDWANRFIFRFKLEIPQVVIGVARLRRRALGQFRYGHNDLGLCGEVLIDERHLRNNLEDDRWWRVLGTLLHELVHGWQQAHGKPGRGNYHNKEFRRKAADFGLIVNQRGQTQYDPGSPFFDLLERQGVRVPLLSEPTLELPNRREGDNSKLKLWICSCPVRVRVAISDFQAQCLLCGCRFERETP